MNFFKKAIFLTGYAYGGVACLLGLLLSTLFSWLPIPPRTRERWTRQMIHCFCAAFFAYLRFFGVFEINFSGLSELKRRRGVIIAANHPTYIDALLIMSQTPHVFCLTKTSVLKNPWVATIAKSAGYESNADPRRLIENCCARLRRGENLLVFPEGTRTSTPPIGPLKGGFGLMAGQAPAPVVTLLITSLNGRFMRKGESFLGWPPSLPVRYRLSISEEFLPEAHESTRQFGLRIESHFRTVLSETPLAEHV